MWSTAQAQRQLLRRLGDALAVLAGPPPAGPAPMADDLRGIRVRPTGRTRDRREAQGALPHLNPPASDHPPADRRLDDVAHHDAIEPHAAQATTRRRSGVSPRR